ncbi:MAG: glycoside hydrolase family 3 protein, partial [Oscillospiraceae bacterium]|nr:glycoside hydrolase family 3 protein [Oscillospiraceae bacterium]
MSLKDKIRLCSGADFWHTKAMPKYGILSFSMADGPHGLRWQNGKTDMLGINNSLPATCFPPAVTAGATWDEELLALQGQAIGEEALAYGVDIVLGPGCNIKRDPLCGRNFEYFSEDPFLSGKLAAAFIKGQQSTGVSSCLKHFAANNQEYKRQSGDSRVDE